ncbi:olfactory receptor 8G17-like [Paramisgurnus dabryanus]|uniref:olfactory receptor 8G17-like n=1 Tax=Paramisgurnus dabryanus TaxID=90735 RepID=UPI0031F3D656
MDNLTFTNSLLLVEGLKVTPQSSYPVFILLLLVYIFEMGCNIILIILISTQKNLHHPMHFLFCNLPLNDILGSTVMLPRLLQDILKEASDRYMTYVECVVQAYFVHIFAVASHYVLMLGLTIRLSRCRYKIENPFCDNASLFKLSCENVSVNNVFGIIYTIMVFTLSLGSVFITYFKIATVCITSKNKALNSKAIKTCSTHLAVYLIMFVSGATFIFLHRVPEYSDSRKLASIMFHIVPPGLNPLVYGLQTKEIREIFFKLWRRNKLIAIKSRFNLFPPLIVQGMDSMPITFKEDSQCAHLPGSKVQCFMFLAANGDPLDAVIQSGDLRQAIFRAPFLALSPCGVREWILKKAAQSWVQQPEGSFYLIPRAQRLNLALTA